MRIRSEGRLWDVQLLDDSTMGRHLWQLEKWAVYSPTGVCVGRYDTYAEAEAERKAREVLHSTVRH